MEYRAATSEEMEKVGQKIASALKGGDVVLLYGDLGAGKTTLTKGIAKGLGVKKTAISPTFSLINVYDIKTFQPTAGPPLAEKHKNIKTFIHVDTYRLKNKEELINIGITDYLGEKNTVCVIEWPDKVEDLLADKKIIKISIQYIDGERRKIDVD